ncbi:WRB/Get1 family [Lentinula detonsa]|uniref:WRB/Get1 family n=1 Tax=Lentinula detonsa TaxID=2804962 RepID=A0A9W8P975_9AGAR|nr:WRB/Get1 family [Lentinula detonsa]KAJ3981496.1 WRB/Get1 family [Lentinula detonsa]
MSLIVAIFCLVLLAEVISWIGKSVLIGWFYILYLRLFYPTLAEKQKKLKTDILNTKAELLKTSAQDQFAKWAKLRRSVDKGLADLEKLNSEMNSVKTSFSVKFSSGIWICTTGAQFVIGWWYRKTAIFYLPPGWFGPLTWVLAFPFAPKGAVSVGMWQMACRRVIKIGERAAKELAASYSTLRPASVSEKKTS